MLPLESFHRLAASRGDGLRPELLELVARRAAMLEAGGGVTDIGSWRQAGPNPAPALPGELPGNVTRFPSSAEGGRAGMENERKDQACSSQ